MMTIFAVGLLLAASWMVVAAYPFPSATENMLAFCNYGLGQIILLALCLSESFGISPKTLVLGQFVMVGIAAFVWNRKGRPGLPGLAGFWQKFGQPGQKTIWITLALVAAVIILLAINVNFYRSAPSMNKDALSYHLPRAYYWLQQGNLHYLPIDDFRWTEFPPNSSIILMWMMALGIGYEWMHLPQVLGAIMIALGVYRLTILCSGNRLAATCVAVICIGFPATIYQMGTSGNDLIVGGLIVSCVVFLAQSLHPKVGIACVRRSSICAGISLGIGVGTKLTFLLTLPALAIFSIGTLVFLGWKNWLARIISLLLAGTIGTALLGSYGYVQNFQDHGSFALSEASNNILAKLPPEVYSPLPNIVLSAYQTLSWHGLQSKPSEIGPVIQRKIIWAIDRKINLGLDKLAKFNNDSNLTELFTDENRAGYGILGFLILLSAPIVGIISLRRFFRTRNFENLLLVSLVILGLSSLILFCFNAPWGPTRARYLIQFIPLLVPPVICAFCTPAWARAIFCTFCSLLALWVMLFCIALEPSRKAHFLAAKNTRSPLQLYLGGRWMSQVDILKSAVTPGKSIGYSGRLDSWAFVLPRELPGYSYILLRPDEIKSSLASGRVDAAIVESAAVDASAALPLPGTILQPKQSIYVRNPNAILLKNLEDYGISVQPGRDLMTLNAKAIETFSTVHQLWPTSVDSRDCILFFLPRGLLSDVYTDIQVIIPLDKSFLPGMISKITCNSQKILFLQKNDKLEFVIPKEVICDSFALQVCKIYFNKNVSLMLKGDNDFPNVMCFEVPWTISLIPK